jgi:gliding motility-associated-like protein
MLKRTSLLVCTIVCVFFLQSRVIGQTTTFKTGTAIIDMGSATPTVKNSLKPYGLIYALLKDNHVPINVVVNESKVKDGIDFVYNGKSYKGGTFIVSADYISPNVATILNTWANQGVVIDYSNSSFTVNVLYKINFVPKWVMDKTNGSISVGFLNTAGIPSSAYTFKTPAQLDACDDIFILPHADPTWDSHKNLLAWNRDFKGAIWAGCHAVSVLENLFNPITPAEKMNFLSTNGLVPFTDHNNTTTPFTNFLPGDAVAQFLFKTDNAQLGGSETVYLPKIGSSWNPSAKIITTSSAQADVPSLSPGAAVENIYGRGFGEATRGYVAYQASHNIGGTGPDNIAAQRIFFGFSLYAMRDKIPPIIDISLTGLSGTEPELRSGSSITLHAVNSGSGAISAYKWTATINGVASSAFFDNDAIADPVFTPTGISSTATCIISCEATGPCGRVSFDSKSITIIPQSPPIAANGIRLTIKDGCISDSVKFNVLDSNVNVNAGTRTLVNVTNVVNGTVLTNTAGDITFFATTNFKGTATATYTIINAASVVASGPITITVGSGSGAPALVQDNVTAIANSIKVINVLANDKDSATAPDGGHLYIRDISVKPSQGYVYINTNGTISYLSKNAPNTTTGDSFQYTACNTTGYCASGLVSVTLVDVCGTGKYQLDQTLTPINATFVATKDTYLDQALPTTPFGATDPLQLRATSGNVQRLLFTFGTLSSLPTTTLVDQANVILTMASAYSIPLGTTAGTTTLPFSATAAALLKNYVEAGSIWNLTDASGWAGVGAGTSGTDFTTIGQNTSAIPFTPGSSKAIGDTLRVSIKTITQNWITTPANNFGMRLVGALNKTTQVSFVSRENADNTKRPTLSVDYYPCLVTDINYTPVAYPDVATTSSAAAISVSPLSNDLNYYTVANGYTAHTNSLLSITIPAHGTATKSGNVITYTPSGNFAGFDTLTYTVRDDDNLTTSTATIRITVSRAAPSINPDAKVVSSGLSVTVDDNDTDLQGPVAASPIITVSPKNGAAIVSGATIIYTPSDGFTGNDTLIYRRFGARPDSCTVPLSDTALVVITVNNRVPIANPASLNTFACAPVTINLLSIASDPENGTLSVTITGDPSSGTLTVTGRGIYKYIPNNGFVGGDSFTYTVTDPLNAASTAATVSISVSGASNPNTAPIAVADTDNTLKDQPVYTNVLNNDSDPNNDLFGISITAIGLTGPLSGTITLMPNKLVKYQPNTDFVGTDTYQYQITDSHGSCSVSGPLSAIATVTITVKGVPTTLSGTVWNDKDKSAAPGGVTSFVGIQTLTETGTNGSGSLYVYATDNTGKIIDKTPVDIDGTYLLSNVPSSTGNLKLILSIEDLAVDAVLNAGSVPTGYVNTTPLTRALPTTTSTDMGPYDWGIYSDPTLFPGTIIGPAGVCGTAIPGTLTSTASATGGSVTATGYVYQWQSSIVSASTGFADIAGATTASYIPSAAIATTTYFQRKVSTNLNSAVFSNVVTIAFVANPTISISPVSATIAAGGNTVLTATGGDIYAWSPTTGLSSTTTAAVTANPLSTTMYTVTGTLSPSGCVNTSAITVTVINPGTIGTNQTNCGTFTPASLTSIAPANDASGTAAFSYQWQSSVTSTTTGFSSIDGAVATSYVPSAAITRTTYYRRVATSNAISVNSNVVTAAVNTIPAISLLPTSIIIQKGFTATLIASGATSYAWSPSTGLSSTTTATVIAGPASSTTYTVTGTSSGCSNTANIDVTVIDPGTIGSNQANCGPFKPAPLTSIADASGTGTITYQWQSSITSAATGFSNITSATTTAYAPAATITGTTFYRRVATGAGQSYNSNVIAATVNTIPVIAITPTSVTISAGLTQTFTASGATTYVWSPSTGLSSSTTATVIASPVTNTTYSVTGTVTTSGCTSTGSVIVTILNPGTIGSNQANCGPFKPTTLTSVTDASGTGTISYQWQSSTISSSAGFSNIASATTTAFTPSAAITATTYYRRVATGSGKSYNSNVITATVNAIPVITIVPTSVIISAGLTQTLTAGGATSYVWSPATDLSSTTTAVVIASPVTTTLYTVTGTINTSGCSGTGSVLITVVSPGTLIPGIIGSPQTICSGTAAAAFTSTAASGGQATINYQWQQSTDNVSFTNIVGATSATYGAGTLSQTTYYKRGASTSGDAVVYTLSVKVNVLPRPVIVGGINGPCAMPKDTIKTFSVTPALDATNYIWTIPSTGGWSGSSTTHTIDVKAGSTNGTISVMPYNGSCAGTPVDYTISIIDYARVTISGTPVAAAGNNNNPIKVTIQLIDITGNVIGCSGGPATLCSNSGTFTTVVDNGDGTYTSYLTSSANDVTICGAVAGVQISQTTKVTFTGPQGGIKSNGPILDFEIPKITFTATEGRAPFTVIYHSAKSPVGKNDTLINVTSGTAYPVKLIPSTTVYTLVSVIDANNERRDNNFIRDTTTTIVLAPKVIITLKADTPKKEADSTWATRIVVHTKNIGDMDLSNSQARLNLRTVFPLPVTYVLDSVRVSGRTVVPNRNYDGILNEDLFARLNKGRQNLYNSSITANAMGLSEQAAPDGSASIEMWTNASNGQPEDMDGLEVVDDGHSIYMFGPMSSLPVNEDATIILWLHVKPNGYTEPFIMQAVALGTGSTEGATALTTSLSNDNEEVSAHPEITKKGDPLPAIINLFPIASIGAALSAGTPVLQGNGTYNVTLSYNVKNYGNLNLKNVQLSQDLLRSIGVPSTFNVVGAVTSTGNLIPNPAFNAKSDTNMLLPLNSILGYKQESTLSYVINITPNQLSSIYRLQAITSGYSDDILATVTDLSNDGTEPDTDGNNIPSEKVITTIVINQPVPPLVPGNISTPAASCVSATGITMSQASAPTGGLDSYLYQWQSSVDNITFFDIIGAESSSYTTGLVNKNTYYRRATISGSQVKYSNAVLLQIYPVPAVPVITGTGSMVVGKGSITLTAPLSAAYAWSTGATTRTIFVQDAGNYALTITDGNGCTAIAAAFAITALDPGKVADVQKILSKAPALQADGSFLLSFNILASNLRTELLDSVRLKDDLSKVFPSYATFSIVDIKASGALIANSSYDGKSQIDLLNDVSKLSASKTDSVQITIKVFPNGFAGTLNNVVNLTGRSPFGTVAVASNDPINNANPAVRLPTKFVIPAVDIFIPSGYSPNRDGINDQFVIIRPFNTTIHLEIFNRWSNLVYKSIDYKNDWAGKGNQANRVLGEDLPDGTYYYVVLATDKTTGSVRKFAGVVTLKR